MPNILDDLDRYAGELEDLVRQGDKDENKSPVLALEHSVNEVSKAWSGSWFGYHSRVYYEGFQPPPPGEHFSPEWGLMDNFGGGGSVGDWREYPENLVRDYIYTQAPNPDLTAVNGVAKKARETFDAYKFEILSLLDVNFDLSSDSILDGVKQKIENSTTLEAYQLLNRMIPTGQMMSRDSNAILQGKIAPVHLEVASEITSIKMSFDACNYLAKLSRQIRSHVGRLPAHQQSIPKGSRIFIGHGNSSLWEDLKQFLENDLRLEWDEFNRIPPAGFSTTERLSQMLEAANFAFLVLTGEDQTVGGKLHPRMNVIHEAGLLQGKLGFSKAIVLLEEGCEEFSNITGLAQIRFELGNIATAFDEIKRVLKREEIIES